MIISDSRSTSRRALVARMVLLALVAAATTLLAASGGARLAAAGDAAGGALPPGLDAFLTDDFGGVTRQALETNALPYKVVATALVMAEEARTGRAVGRAALPELFQRFGFLPAPRIANAPGGDARLPGSGERPLGMPTKMVTGPIPGVRIDVATLGCASCHTGVTYDAAGAPHPDRAWAGFPNTSLNLEAYTQAVYAGLQAADADPAAFRRRFAALFPEAGTAERLTLRFGLQPRVHARLAALRRAGHGVLPFSNGGAGRTNGVASLKHQLRLDRDPTQPGEVGFTSIPALGDRGLRTSLLYDGVYAPPGAPHFGTRAAAAPDLAAHSDRLAAITAFFTVPTMGVPPERAAAAIPRMRPVLRWLTTDYRSPPFPGAIDGTLAASGRATYDARCASCHGTYAEGPPPRRLVSYPNRLSPQAEIGTDSLRWAAITDTLLDAFARSRAIRPHIAAQRTGGYVAPILSGVWASAPYLHNGSVPTLWQLLTPAERPAVFDVGGHALDLTRVGIAGAVGADGVYRYPAGYTPWSTPEQYDTRRPGLSNRGHEREAAGLTEGEKRALIEYLKGL